HEEQADASGSHGAEEVLPVVPQAHGAQRDQVARMIRALRARALSAPRVLGEASKRAVEAPFDWNRGVALTARAPDSKSGGWGFESLHPCHHWAARVTWAS